MEPGIFEITTADGLGVRLAMQRLWLTGQVLPVGARLQVQHTFRNGEDRMLEVVYAFMLPRDAALRRFEVRGESFSAHSELKRVQQAVREYEEGIEAGHLATLARSYRDGVVNLTLGNLRPAEEVSVTLEILAGVEMHDDSLRFRFPFTLAPGYHPQALMIDTGGEGEIELPVATFGDVFLPKYRSSADGLHEVGFDLALRIPGQLAEVGSPSHAIRVREDHGTRRAALAPAAEIPDRDLVLDVRMAEPATQVLAGEGHFAIAVPSTRFGQRTDAPRKVAIVIDRSGSMRGQPMAQARRAVEACLAALSPEDQFAIVAFDNSPETFRNTLVKPTSEARKEAQRFLKGIDARGGTGLALGFSAGAKLVPGGDVLVITDGQVMGTEKILAQARALNIRIHCLGIGSASQDRFLAQLAHATGGVSRFVTPRERVDVAAVDLFASIGRPVASDVSATGATFAAKPADTVLAGTPWVAFGEAGENDEVRVVWQRGSLKKKIVASQSETADTIRLLHGARQIADLESRMTSEAEKEAMDTLLALSERFGLASRAMALVAVVERAGDQAGAPPKTHVVPVGMPHDTRYDSYFGRLRQGGDLRSTIQGDLLSLACMPAPEPTLGARYVFQKRKKIDHLEEVALDAQPRCLPGAANDDDEGTDRLMEIAASLTPVGGMPGGSAEDRALKTIAALLVFLAEGHTPTEGAFRAHVERMVRFLEALKGLPADRQKTVDQVVAFARAGKQPAKALVGAEFSREALGLVPSSGIAGRVGALLKRGKGANSGAGLSWEAVEKAIA